MNLKPYIVHLLSGGLDSVAMLYELVETSHVHCLMFDYGQVHRDELKWAKIHAERLHLKYTIAELMQVKHLFQHSALTDGSGSNIVPNRNAVFLHIAAGIAFSIGADLVTIGCNKDDRANFPDCTPQFIATINASLKESKIKVEVCAPYSALTKTQIVARAKEKGWPFRDSTSCYRGTNCMECDACIKRAEALL